jgi:hypothetical protein
MPPVLRVPVRGVNPGSFRLLALTASSLRTFGASNRGLLCCSWIQGRLPIGGGQGERTTVAVVPRGGVRRPVS